MPKLMYKAYFVLVFISKIFNIYIYIYRRCCPGKNTYFINHVLIKYIFFLCYAMELGATKPAFN